MKKSKEKDKKLTIILGGIAGLLMFILGITAFLSYNGGIKEKIEINKQRIKNDISMVKKKGSKQVELEYLQNKRVAFDQRLLSGDTPAVAAAELQTILNDMASEFDLMISSQRIITPKEHGIFLEVPVQITTQCTVTKLQELLYQIETYSILLSISNLDIQVVRRRENKEVKATIDISGVIINRSGIS